MEIEYCYGSFDVRFRGKAGSHGQTVKMTRLTVRPEGANYQ
jgi:hypothetical protein